nr:hypothetical protein [Tanacetum cinerariifolium]
MRPSFRPAGHRPHGPLMNPWRPTMNGARPYKSFFQAPSYETRPFLKSSAVKNPYRAPWVPTVNRKFTTDSTKNHTADMGRKGKAENQRETIRSQNHSYKSFTHRSAGHRPNGAHMRPPFRSSGPRPHGNSMRPPFRHAGHRPHGPSMNPMRPIMNGARSYKTFFQTPSFETRPFFKSSAVNNSYRAPWVPTVNRAVPRTTLMTKVIGTVAALGT